MLWLFLKEIIITRHYLGISTRKKQYIEKEKDHFSIHHEKLEEPHTTHGEYPGTSQDTSTTTTHEKSRLLITTESLLLIFLL